VDDIQAAIRRLQEKNVQMLDREPRVGAHKARIAFAHPKSFSGVLFEMKQRGDAS
jgi:methylmalonyl-CoA/ethylmalonyl-CoA epimerase